MNSFDEILGAIDILVQGNKQDNTQVRLGVVQSVNGTSCNIKCDNVVHTLRVYGGTVTPNRTYPIVAPNGNFSQAFVIGDTVEDYVTETGTSGGWTYRKWASGIAECWGELTTTVTSSGQIAGWNTYYGEVSMPSGLFISVNDAQVRSRVAPGYNFTGMSAFSNPTTLKFVGMSNDSAFETAHVFAHVMGNWK